MRNVCIHITEMYTPITVFQRGPHLGDCPATTTVLKFLIISSLILCFIKRACLENRTRRASMVPYCPTGIWPLQSPRRTKFQGTKEEWEFSSVKLRQVKHLTSWNEQPQAPKPQKPRFPCQSELASNTGRK